MKNTIETQNFDNDCDLNSLLTNNGLGHGPDISYDLSVIYLNKRSVIKHWDSFNM